MDASSIIITLLLRVKHELENRFKEQILGPKCDTFLLYKPERFSLGYLLSQINIIRKCYLTKIISEFDILLFLYFAFILFLDVKFLFSFNQQFSFFLAIVTIVLLFLLYIMYVLYLLLFSIIFYLIRLTATPAVRVISWVVAVTYFRGALLTDAATMLHTSTMVAIAMLVLILIVEQEKTLFKIFKIILSVTNSVIISVLIEYLKNLFKEKIQIFYVTRVNQLCNLYYLSDILIQDFRCIMADYVSFKLPVSMYYFVSTIASIISLLILVLLLQKNKIKLLDNKLLVIIMNNAITKTDIIKAIYNCQYNVFQKVFQEILDIKIDKVKSIYLIDLQWIINYLSKFTNSKKVDIYLDPAPIKESSKELYLVRKMTISKNGIASLWISEESLIRLVKLSTYAGGNINEIIKKKLIEEIDNHIFYAELEVFNYLSLIILSSFLIISILFCKNVLLEKCFLIFNLTFVFILFPPLLMYLKENKLGTPRRIIQALPFALILLSVLLLLFIILFFSTDYITAVLSLSAFVTSCLIVSLYRVLKV